MNQSIAVVIPTYNQENYIGDCLESVHKQIKKTDEVWVIDDASTDHTVSFVSKHFPKVQLVLNKENKGPSYSRNRGISSSQSDLITFLDADDFWKEDKLAWQYEYLDQHQEIEMVAGLTEYFFSPEISQKEAAKHPLAGKSYFNAYLGSFLIKRAVFERVGLFDESLRLSEDQDWFLRAREAQVTFRVRSKVALMKRIHIDSTTSGLTFEQSGLLQVLHRSIQRRKSYETIQIGPIEYHE